MSRARSEFDVIATLFAPLSKDAPGALGLKDDAASIDAGPERDIIVTVDTVIEGVHFLPDDPAELVARKALRVNLSDLAAKGSEPIGFLLALTVNRSITDAYLERFASGLAEDVAAFGVPLLGGDTTAGSGPLTVSITALGGIPKGGMIRRGGAKPGDLLCVTGTIGDAALGLAYLRGNLKLTRSRADELVTRYRVPLPRLAAGVALRGRARACLDISDGLVADVGHLCEVSGVAALIERDLVPLSEPTRAVLALEPERWLDVLGGGDDYELAFSLPESDLGGLSALAEKAEIPLTVIGRIVGAENAKLGSVTVLDSKGNPIPVPVAGYQHR